MPKRKHQLSSLIEENNVNQKEQKMYTSTHEDDSSSTTSSISQEYEDALSSGVCSNSDSAFEDMTLTDSLSKKQKKHSVSFEDVTVYYFDRSQGFVCVPSAGGTTLGMAQQHSHSESYTINDFARRQRHIHKSILRERKILPPSVSTTIHSLNNDDSIPITNIVNYCSDEDIEEQLPVHDYYFLQPVPTRERRSILKQSGIKKIDNQEKKDLQLIRQSRETCGCSCVAKCDPFICECSQNGISCQVDRRSFPCACSRLECRNPNGRTEFNPIRVRNHFLDTIMRLELEERSLQIDVRYNNLDLTNISDFEQRELLRICHDDEDANHSCDMILPSSMTTVVSCQPTIVETPSQSQTEIPLLLSSVIDNVVDQDITTTAETVLLSIVSSIEYESQPPLSTSSPQLDTKKISHRKSYRSSSVLKNKLFSLPPLSIKSNTHSYNTRTRCSKIIKKLLTKQDLVSLTAE
ncbi:unnamed protein product [Didymodactylos carnosus]|uniref:Cysteine/serine-rich nuclear protein N-terminal domain-containing protein n=1 Tax=Didymodactylos carnosus TaxID=1234261 RepID=A0A814EBT6_9BILA|nr:unnamed protein product [Didymodactylos carnosus]CAF0966707.1 unnamed protein product [Didymodactylos carnosus]CAF3697864.1 unnamed protein product [Didymodactylos carnosus]CAF3740215.1 unnamed protein product [Didymodactylos carnosus]